MNETNDTAVVNYDPQPAQSDSGTRLIAGGEIVQQKTADECRIDSVAKLMDAAYLKASTLELTAKEREQLLADFPDEDVKSGAKGDNNLLYIDHQTIRRRLLEVFGPGKWTLVVRRLWPEHYKTAKNEPAVRVYAECVLLVRGCMCGESVGAGNYFPNNPKLDYSDAAEAAQSEALRRIAAKHLGIGLQVWSKSWCEAWKHRQRQPRQEQPQQPPRDRPTPVPPTKQAPRVPKDGTELAKWLDGYDSLTDKPGIAQTGLWQRNALVQHVASAFAARHGYEIEKWPSEVIVDAMAEARQFDTDARAAKQSDAEVF